MGIGSGSSAVDGRVNSLSLAGPSSAAARSPS